MPDDLVLETTDVQILSTLERVVELLEPASDSENVVVSEVETTLTVDSVVTQVVESASGDSTIIEVSTQGAPGPTGPAGSIQHTATAAIALGGHRAILLNASGATYADNATEAHAGRVSGITLGAVSSGAQVSFQSAGMISELSWSWVPGDDIWLGTNGLLTQAYPSGAAFAQLIGYAITATSIWVELGDPVIQ